jgi:hypothetical protein
MLREVAPDLFTAEDLLALPAGVKMPVRMTAVRLPRGGLVVHSPLALTDGRLVSVARVAAVEYLVAPSCRHHRFVGPWVARFAGAKLYGAPGLGRKRKDLRLAGVLGEEDPPPWAAVLDQILIEGAPGINETVFLHRPTGSLIVTDLLFNIVHPANLVTRLTLAVTGTSGRLAMSRLWRRYTKDRKALKASVERVLAWDFQRILPAHGDIVEGADVVARARDALAWALK